MYEHRYKYGKQKAIMTVEEFKEKLEASRVKLEQKAFLVLLWHSGARKSEVYERVKDDIEITDAHVIVDFHQRKKHGETVPPLKIPRKFYGVEEYRARARKLCQHGRMAQDSIMRIHMPFKPRWYLSINYKDMTETEKTYGADMAFILSSDIRDRMNRRKIILVQCKKMNTRQYPSPGIAFVNSWPIDYGQARNLCRITPFGFHFLYGTYSNAVCTRVAPSGSVMGLMRATRRKRTIPLYQALLISRSFADFFLYDFIGCWVGDEREIALKMVESEVREIRVRYLVYVDISHG